MAKVTPPESATTARYARANALVHAVLNKFHNGSARAVDPFVIRALRAHEPRLVAIQCFLEEGPPEQRRQLKGVASTVSHPQFTLCGTFCGPGAVLREWEALSKYNDADADAEAAEHEVAMAEYLDVVDKTLPGWDDASPEHPVTSIDRFWQDDAAVSRCPLCSVSFSLHTRRHHCRLCLAVFCATCTAQMLELALCPGAPLRAQRVCAPCFQAAGRADKLREVRRLARENHELAQRIQAALMTAQHALDDKQRQERELREAACAAGCDLHALDDPMAAEMALPSPPAAHRFAPTQVSVESANQLALANRQLTMSYKVAQCRAHKALDRMDTTLETLRAAVQAATGSPSTTPMASQADTTLANLDFIRSFLAPDDHQALECVSTALHHRLQPKLLVSQRPVAALEDASIALRWHTQCLQDDKTRAYVTDLADAIRARLDTDSGSDTEDSDPNETLLTSGSSTASSPTAQAQTIPTATDLDKAYALIVAQCETGPASEWDDQIRLDVQRTFGVSARSQYRSNMPNTSQTPAAALPVEARRTALQNVLCAFASVDTEVGYCQGMDRVAALLLAVSDWNEARAFWLLIAVLASPRFELERLYGPGLPHLGLRCFQLERLLHQHLPALSEHLEAMDFPISIVATGWFLTLFSNMEALSFDVVVRVFDGFLVHGWKQLFRVALTILEELQGPMLASSFDEIPRLFYDIQAYAPRLLVVEHVLEQAATYKVTNSALERLQDAFEQQTASASTSNKSSPAKPDLTSNLSAPDSTDRRSLKSAGMTTTTRHQAAAFTLDGAVKAPSSTREASPPLISRSSSGSWEETVPRCSERHQ